MFKVGYETCFYYPEDGMYSPVQDECMEDLYFQGLLGDEEDVD